MQLRVSRCSAEIYGGCFYLAPGQAEFAAPLFLRDCEADGTGGGIYAQAELVAQEVRCSRCKAPTSGCLELTYGQARLGKVAIDTGSRLPSASSVVGAGANASITVGGVDCRDAPGCTLAVEHLNLTRLLCQQGESRQPLAEGTGQECKECRADEIRLVAPDEAGCRESVEPESRCPGSWGTLSGSFLYSIFRLTSLVHVSEALPAPIARARLEMAQPVVFSAGRAVHSMPQYGQPHH